MTRLETEPPSERVLSEFKFQFECLVVLDYITRNTDRGNDNWLIKYERPTPQQSNHGTPNRRSRADLNLEDGEPVKHRYKGE